MSSPTQRASARWLESALNDPAQRDVLHQMVKEASGRTPVPDDFAWLDHVRTQLAQTAPADIELTGIDPVEFLRRLLVLSPEDAAAAREDAAKAAGQRKD